jgi:hypothetical protein
MYWGCQYNSIDYDDCGVRQKKMFNGGELVYMSILQLHAFLGFKESSSPLISGIQVNIINSDNLMECRVALHQKNEENKRHQVTEVHNSFNNPIPTSLSTSLYSRYRVVLFLDPSPFNECTHGEGAWLKDLVSHGSTPECRHGSTRVSLYIIVLEKTQEQRERSH